MEPPKMGDGVLASSSGGENGLLLFSVLLEDSARTAALAERALRSAGRAASAGALARTFIAMVSVYQFVSNCVKTCMNATDCEE